MIVTYYAWTCIDITCYHVLTIFSPGSLIFLDQRYQEHQECICGMKNLQPSHQFLLYGSTGYPCILDAIQPANRKGKKAWATGTGSKKKTSLHDTFLLASDLTTAKEAKLTQVSLSSHNCYIIIIDGNLSLKCYYGIIIINSK